MFTVNEIENMVKVSDQCNEIVDKLTAYCDIIAIALGYNGGATKVWLSDEAVNFTAEWYGSYQSYDSKSFSFPLTLLTKPAEEVTAVLLDIVKKENALEKEKQDNWLKETRRHQYLQLKKEFE